MTRVLYAILSLIPLLSSAFIDDGIRLDKSERPSVVRLSISPYLGTHSLSFVEKKGWDSSSCTATIVSPRVILTAKHCVRSYPSNLNYDDKNNLRIKIYIMGIHQKNLKIQGIYKVPFGSSTKDGKLGKPYMRYDIAAIILDKESSDKIILNNNELVSNLSLCKVNNGDYASFTGFGNTESSWENLKLLFNSSTKTFTEFNLHVNYRHSLYIMTRNNSGSSFDSEKYNSSQGSMSNQGDSGGPIMNQLNEVIAIHSAGNVQRTNSFNAPLRVIKNIEFLTHLIKNNLLEAENIACYDQVKDTKLIITVLLSNN